MPLHFPPSTSWDELIDPNGLPRHPAVHACFDQFDAQDLRGRQAAIEERLRAMGVTFAVYGDDRGIEKVWPFDVLPRVIDNADWEQTANGLRQRIRALNLFLDDVYGHGKILKDGVVPESLIRTCKAYQPLCEDYSPPNDVWVHITGTDLVRHEDGRLHVLEDNLRCPSGVSYVLGNREVLKRTMPEVFSGLNIASVEDYPEHLLNTLQQTAPANASVPHNGAASTVVLLTPGIYNSAYFEHTFLAQQMGIDLVEGQDLVVEDDRVYKKTVQGLRPVEVIYRRIDDDFLDPECFREDSALGVPGLMRAYRAGNVTLANAPGTGIADDKAIYAYVPAIIKYYLGEDAILENVPTYLCSEKDQCDHVLRNIDTLVVKPVAESGGYGILLGPLSTAEERDICSAAIRANPRNYIAQPMLNLSTVPTLIEDRIEPRHVDMRPFILHGGDEIYVLPGGLTRVALKAGSMVVNSSQGGGSKDTWVITSS